jgi:hypothetical protein
MSPCGSAQKGPSDLPSICIVFGTPLLLFGPIYDPVNVRGAKDLLGQTTFATTEKHYIMAQLRLAGRALARTIDNLKSSATFR